LPFFSLASAQRARPKKQTPSSALPSWRDDCADDDDARLRLWQLNAILAFENRPTAPITPRDDFVMGLFRERDALAAAQ